MVENFAQQTANQMVDTIVSSDPHRTENAYALLASKFQSDSYGTGSSPQSGSQFINDVFSDINGQYTDGKSVPENLAFAWASQQLGHELPADGFNQQDLQGIESSTDSNVTVLDKYMASVLLSGYQNLQHDSQIAAEMRITEDQGCAELQKDSAAFVKEEGGIPAPGTLGGNVYAEMQCKMQTQPGDQQRAQGVIREIPAIDIQTKLRMADPIPSS